MFAYVLSPHQMITIFQMSRGRPRVLVSDGEDHVPSKRPRRLTARAAAFAESTNVQSHVDSTPTSSGHVPAARSTSGSQGLTTSVQNIAG